MTPNKNKALQALLTQPTKKAAAKAAGITTRTLANYLSDPDFMERYREAYQEILEETARAAQQRIAPAFETLQQIIESDTESGQVKITAIRTLLEYSLKLLDVVDTQKRLKELQSIVEELENERNKD